MKAFIAAFLAVALLAACSDEESGLAVVVFESGPRLAQCEPPAVTPQQSAARLEQAGIEVQRTSCGVRTGIAYPAVCGGPTGDVILHDIPAATLAEAQARGFEPAETLVDHARDTGWQRVSCDGLDPFRELTNDAGCAQTRNRLVLIQSAAHLDTQLILLDQAGNCADAAYRQVLYGESVEDVLCSNADSIAGPMKNCPAATYSMLFETIIANLDAPDLGLGPEYDVGVIN